MDQLARKESIEPLQYAAQDGTSAVGHKSFRAQASVERPPDQNRTSSGKVSICNLSCPQWAVL